MAQRNLYRIRDGCRSHHGGSIGRITVDNSETKGAAWVKAFTGRGICYILMFIWAIHNSGAVLHDGEGGQYVIE